MKIIKSIPAQKVFFKEETIADGNERVGIERTVVNLFDEVEYQQMQGFGGAFTESSAYIYSLLSPAQKADFLEKYFSRENGIGYNFGRTHINSCDFSIDIYSYVDEGDETLESFSLERDRKYIIPFLKDALNYCKEEIVLFASPWSPPAYMKDNGSVLKGGSLKDEYKALWAKYYARYIKEMAKEGITISAISVQTEPIAVQTWESCYYSPEYEREFIEHYLAPVLDSEGLGDIKIIVWDHNKERVYDRAKKIFQSPAVKERVWGIGHHWYSGDHFDGIRIAYEQFGKTMISSEICCPITEDSISAAERYGKELSNDFNNFTAAFCDWNLLLDTFGGPYHNRYSTATSGAGVVYEDKSKGCYAPVLFDTEKKELIYTPIYYYIGHFSKFVQKGAYRIGTTKYCEQILATGFKNPDGSLALVVQNSADCDMRITIRHNDVCTALDLEAHSIITALL